MWRKLEEKWKEKTWWQFVKFNLVSFSITVVQLLLANLLPLLFDSFRSPLPVFLRGIFDPAFLFEGQSPYVADGVVTWGYVLPFFLSNFIANIYGYYMNRKATFHGTGSRKGLILYLCVLFALILFSTWMQGALTAFLSKTPLASLARTIAAMAAGTLQVAVLFPLEKFVLFKE